MKEDKVEQALNALNRWFGKSDELKVVINLLEEALAPEPRFYKDQQVIGGQDGLSIKGIFIGFSKENGSYIYKVKRGDETVWCDSCEPDPDAESIINWISFKDQRHPLEKPNHQVIYSTCNEYHASIPDPEFLT